MRVSQTVNAVLVAAFLAVACGEDAPTAVEGTARDGRVFLDSAVGYVFQAFPGTSAAAVQRDTDVKYSGSASLRVTVPARTRPVNNFASGAFVASAPRDLRQYDALTFYVRSSITTTFIAGFGTNASGMGNYSAERFNIPATTSWQKVVVPIPLASRLSAESGLFYFDVAAPWDGPGHDLWFDEIQFEQFAAITNPRVNIFSSTRAQEVGVTEALPKGFLDVAVSGSDVSVRVGPSYFNWRSSNTAVATVAANRSTLSIVGAGTSNLTATLGAVTATGTRTYTGALAPSTAPAAPTRPAGQVLSIFSGAYTNVAVSSWTAFSGATFSDVSIGGNAVKRYQNFEDLAITLATPADITTMGGLHLDVYVHNASFFSIGMVDYGADGVTGGGDDSEGFIGFGSGGQPALTVGAWNSLDIPLSAFADLTGRSKLALISFLGSSPTTYIDNVYFYQTP